MLRHVDMPKIDVVEASERGVRLGPKMSAVLASADLVGRAKMDG